MAVSSRSANLGGSRSEIIEQVISPGGDQNPLNQTVGAAARALRIAALICSGASSLPGSSAPPGPSHVQGRSVGGQARLLGGKAPENSHAVLTVLPSPVRHDGEGSDVEVTRSHRHALAEMIDRCKQARVERSYTRSAGYLAEAVSLVCEGGPLYPREDVDRVRAAGSDLSAAISTELRIHRNDQPLADCMTLVTGVMEKFAERYGQTR